MRLLKTKYTNPIEREYEGWIIARIEEYFLKINKKVRIFAVSPADESSWSADEFLGLDCKIIGLQFKKASLGKKRVSQNAFDFSNVCWHLNNPAAQFPLIQKIKEVFYCLPTFINRDYKQVALDHCLFWRPDSTMEGTTYWYDNPIVNSVTGSIAQKSFRWGQFIENIYKCEIGLLVRKDELPNYIRNKNIINIFRDFYSDARVVDNSQQGDINFEGRYLLFIEI